MACLSVVPLWNVYYDEIFPLEKVSLPLHIRPLVRRSLPLKTAKIPGAQVTLPQRVPGRVLWSFLYSYLPGPYSTQGKESACFKKSNKYYPKKGVCINPPQKNQILKKKIYNSLGRLQMSYKNAFQVISSVPWHQRGLLTHHLPTRSGRLWSLEN